MKFAWSPMAIVLVALMLLPSFAGCGSGAKTASPQQKEEQRQRLIKSAERERREG